MTAILLVALAPAPATPDGPIVDRLTCEQRARPDVTSFDRRVDLVRGPVALAGAQRLSRRSARSFTPEPGELAGAKLPIVVRSGHELRLTVQPSQRGRVALGYGATTTNVGDRIERAAVVVRATSCDPDETGYAGWPGLLHVTGPICARLQVRVDGRRLDDFLLPAGRRCRARATR